MQNGRETLPPLIRRVWAETQTAAMQIARFPLPRRNITIMQFFVTKLRARVYAQKEKTFTLPLVNRPRANLPAREREGTRRDLSPSSLNPIEESYELQIHLTAFMCSLRLSSRR